MRYNPKLPDDTVNVTKDNLIVTMIKLSLSLIIILVILYFILIFTINIIITQITPKQEKKLMNMISSDFMISSKKNNYLSDISKKLLNCSDIPYNIKISLIEEETVNAFASPTGTIYITRGILKKIKNENELAFIIGHEIGHFKNKDHLHQLGYKLVTGFISILIGRNMLIETSFQIGDSKYSQKEELNADSYSLDLMKCAYKTVNGSITFFQRINEGGDWLYFLSTHPGFNKRIEKIQIKIKKENIDTNKNLIPLKEKF